MRHQQATLVFVHHRQNLVIAYHQTAIVSNNIPRNFYVIGFYAPSTFIDNS